MKRQFIRVNGGRFIDFADISNIVPGSSNEYDMSGGGMKNVYKPRITFVTRIQLNHPNNGNSISYAQYDKSYKTTHTSPEQATAAAEQIIQDLLVGFESHILLWQTRLYNLMVKVTDF